MHTGVPGSSAPRWRPRTSQLARPTAKAPRQWWRKGLRHCPPPTLAASAVRRERTASPTAQSRWARGRCGRRARVWEGGAGVGGERSEGGVSNERQPHIYQPQTQERLHVGEGRDIAGGTPGLGHVGVDSGWAQGQNGLGKMTVNRQPYPDNGPSRHNEIAPGAKSKANRGQNAV